MKITNLQNGKAMTLIIEGRIDTNTVQELETKVDEVIDNYETLYFDFENVDYISSAGLRVLLSTQKVMNANHGKFVILNPCEEVKEVFEITGFNDILTIE